MKSLLTCMLLSISLCAAAQWEKFKSTTELADHINSSYGDSSQKLLEAYKWVTTNIRYDATNALAINHGTDSRAVVDVAFARRKGVCENFAAIFSDICNNMGFESVIIEGLTRQHGRIDRQGHSWVAVKTADDWFLFDPTWDVGLKDNFRFFRQTGNYFIDSHIPFDPLWQLMEHPARVEEFFSKRFRKSDSKIYNYKDSISMYLAMDSLRQITEKVSRMERAGISNKLSDIFYKIAKAGLEEKRQEQQMHWYNAATKLLNECTSQLNEFIQYRNNRFLPAKPDSEIASMLDNIDEKMNAAFKYFDSVDASKALLVYGTGQGREQAKRLKASYQRQHEFIQKYISTSLADRNNIFYQKE